MSKPRLEDVQMTNVPAPIADQIRDVLDAVSTGLDVTGVGKAVVGAFVKQRVEAIREQLISDAKDGKIGAINLYDNPNVGGYIFRLMSAIRQGVRAKNIRLLARYLFGEASARQLHYDACVEDATVIETLTDGEMRCLAIYKRAIETGQVTIRPDDPETLPEGDSRNYTMVGVEVGDFFSSADAFHDASLMLQRWGFVRPSRIFTTHAFEPTRKLAEFMSRLDLDGIIDL